MSNATTTMKVGKVSRQVAVTLLRGIATYLLLPLLQRFGKHIAIIAVGLFLVFNFPQVIALLVGGAFTILALRWMVKR